MDYTPNVSVVVPVRDGEKTLEACLRSLLRLAYPPHKVELIVVNNGSTDRTGEILATYGDKIRSLLETKRGPAAARNRGLRVARHEIIAMTDADCVVDSEWLRRLVEPMQDPTVGLVGGSILSQQPCNSIQRFGERIHDHHSAIEVWEPPYVITMNWASRRSLVQRLNFFDECFIRNEDVDFSYRAYEAGIKFTFAPQAIVRHENERTYSSLFREGYQHGFYSVQTIKKHRRLVIQTGYQRFDVRSYVALFSSLRDSFAGERQSNARCALVFNGGKRVGKLVGSMRFGYLDLGG